MPGVGQNLQDHIAAYGLTWTTSAKGTAYNPFLYSLNPMTYIKWKLWKTGNTKLLSFKNYEYLIFGID